MGATAGSRPGAPPPTAASSDVQLTILEKCSRPSFARPLVRKLTALRRDLEEYLSYYNTDRAHTGRHTQARITAEIVYGANNIGAAR